MLFTRQTRITHPALLLQEQIRVTHLEKVFSFIFHYTRLYITRELHENHWKTPGYILHLLSTCLVLQYLLFSKVVQYITSFFYFSPSTGIHISGKQLINSCCDIPSVNTWWEYFSSSFLCSIGQIQIHKKGGGNIILSFFLSTFSFISHCLKHWH